MSKAHPPLGQQVPGCFRLLLQPLLVGGVDQHIAGCFCFCQPAEELLQVQVETLQQLQSGVQSSFPVWNPGEERPVSIILVSYYKKATICLKEKPQKHSSSCEVNHKRPVLVNTQAKKLGKQQAQDHLQMKTKKS